MSKLSKTVKVLVDCHDDKMREISNFKRGPGKAGLYKNLSESEAFDLLGGNFYDGNMRIRPKANKKLKSQCDHPALARQAGRARCGED